jgi:hypothetical protein
VATNRLGGHGPVADLELCEASFFTTSRAGLGPRPLACGRRSAVLGQASPYAR